ncbi:MAG: molybdopterin-dependent oxidoreductase [Dehalococcoidales bacterium]|nr:molybdopterin-dependent oxidoreductase [Dehalococcoidales bacterium]
MKADTVCLRCHQKCCLTAKVENGKIVNVVDSSPENRVPPCTEACPIGMDVRGYVMAISQGKLQEAMAIIRETNPLPLITGRVCPHPCELECRRVGVDKPVAIQWLKRMVADYSMKSGEKATPVARTSKEKIAVIGSGPAGLTAAHDLVKAGYGVTIYEAAHVIGGIPATAIPEFRLPQSVVQADIDYIKGLGIEIKTNTPIGGRVTVDSLRQSYDAVLVAIGCQKSIPLSIPGSDLDGVYDALSWLNSVREGKKAGIGNRVVIIGGSYTAIDAARSAFRLGAKQVTVVYRRSETEMPARSEDVERAKEEGVQFKLLTSPKRFVGNGQNRLTGVECYRMKLGEFDESGRRRPETIAGSEFLIDADIVITAIGQATDVLSLGENQLKITPQGTVAVNPGTLATDAPGLFAAGDCVTGGGTIVGSIAAGRKAAASIIKYLGGVVPEKPVLRETADIEPEEIPDPLVETHRQEMPTLSPTEAIRSFQEVELGYSEQTGIKEAKRCLNCVTACIKGATIPDVMYHPDRLLYPFKRVGKRGEGKWERISWDEALDTIAGKLKEIKEKYGPEAIHISDGSGQKHIGLQVITIAERLWPCPNTHWGRYTCQTPDEFQNWVTFGDSITYEFGPDYEHSKCIVFWGSMPEVGVPAQTRAVYRGLRNGAKLIVIDPRPVPMAKRANIWLRIRPGTDMALALAMANVIINEGLYDKEFVEKWCVGFDKLKEHVKKYPPELAAKITGLSKEDIISTARMYATTKPGCIYVRLGAGAQQVTSTQTARAISILIGLCGNVDVPGGNLLYYRTYRDSLFWHIYDMDKGIMGPAAVEAKRIGAKEYPFMHKGRVCDIPGTIRAMERGEVRGLWCVCDNLLVAEIENRRIWDIMKNKLDFIFVSDYFMTPTAELADIVLPAAFYQEVDLLVGRFQYPSNVIYATPKVVEPPGECRDDREVAIEIAKRMGVDVSPWESVKDWLNWRLKYMGITYDELCQKPGSKITLPREFRRYEKSTPAFGTASGKVELYSSVFEAVGYDPLPVYQEPPDGPVSTPELFKEFPLIYVHYRILSYMHSEGRQIKRQRQLAPYPYLEINPETAARFDIKEGDWVYLETPKFSGDWRVKYKVRFVPEMHPDVVAGPHGWWFPEKSGPEHGCFDSNINAVLSLDPPYDPAIGVMQCRALLCRVRKTESQ